MRLGACVLLLACTAPLLEAFAPGPLPLRPAATAVRARTAVAQKLDGRCDDADSLRAKYLREKAEREAGLLASGLRIGAEERAGADEQPDFITRWGGADLAQEGPTRKVLELMSDSEWAQEDWGEEDRPES